MSSYVPVLTFHKIDETPSVISFPPSLFESFMEKLIRNGYRAVGLTDAVENLYRGAPLPEKTFVLTFDDGYRSVYSEAFPVMKRHGMSATVFLTVGDPHCPGGRIPPLNGSEMLSWAEVTEMREAGIRFGAHTLTHPDLTRLGTEKIEYEIVKSKEIIEGVLGEPVRSFAYPYGRYDERSMGIAGRFFDCACSDELGLLTLESNRYALVRVDAYYLKDERLTSLMLSGMFPYYVRLRNVPRKILRRLGGR
jgi:peptidoglycan/xylan/chitin deacetylase (PgdA/CDA1 family)